MPKGLSFFFMEVILFEALENLLQGAYIEVFKL